MGGQPLSRCVASSAAVLKREANNAGVYCCTGAVRQPRVATEQRNSEGKRKIAGVRVREGAIDCGTCHIFKSRAEVSICHPIITFATPHCGPQPSHATKNSPMPKLTAAKMRVAISSSVE